VFQNPDNQMIASIVEDDIAFGPENLGIPREEIRERVDWALEKVGMSEHKKSTPFKMSGGQKQRIAIAGILAIKPRIIVFDESTAMLDPKGRKEVLNVAKQLNKEENITIIWITHYMDEAVEADRVAIMNDSKIIAIDTPKNIFKRTQLIKDSGLDLPLPLQIANDLREKGFQISEDILTEGELEVELCKILK
ncbi:MAG: ATP-binding cassette domain-containing protein, partial [Clostridia bacterium]|nr:ATP-binding cassette domain-containing protein [Clostridia bacterium]